MYTLLRIAHAAKFRWLPSMSLDLMLLTPAAGTAGVASSAQVSAGQHLVVSFGPDSQCSGSIMPC